MKGGNLLDTLLEVFVQRENALLGCATLGDILENCDMVKSAQRRLPSAQQKRFSTW